MALDRVVLKQYQEGFVFSAARFPTIVSAVGTGKTMALLLKAWLHCEKNEGALALVVRREYTDLRDSTIKDFESYFNVSITSQDKEYEFSNGSKIMFRHGDIADINVLKNINLSFVGIEQGEEYETADVFDFLRDRLRRKIDGVRQMAVIANARGHNWMWQRWIQRAEHVDEIDGETGQYHYKNGQYEAWTANSFANADNLPQDFVDDLRAKKDDAPNQYAQFVLNSFEDVDEDDYLITQLDENINQDIEFCFAPELYQARVLGVDIARYGMDSCAAVVLTQAGPVHWQTSHHEKWKMKDTMETTGRIMDLMCRLRPTLTILDGDGLGVGAVDRLREQGLEVMEFRGGMVDGVNKARFVNKKAEASFLVKEMIEGKKLRVNHPEVMNSARTVKYKFMSNSRRAIVSKEEMRKRGLKSPDDFDALMMAVYGVSTLKNEEIASQPVQKYAIMNCKPNQRFAIGGGIRR